MSKVVYAPQNCLDDSSNIEPGTVFEVLENATNGFVRVAAPDSPYAFKGTLLIYPENLKAMD